MSEEQQIQKIYYQPENLWKGRKAITELRKATGLSAKKVKIWLAKQALWQVHIPPPKRIDHPHYYVTEVNQMRQADLLYLSHDLVYQNTYKYTLNVIDVASRYKATFEDEESQRGRRDASRHLQERTFALPEGVPRRQRYRVQSRRLETDEGEGGEGSLCDDKVPP